MGVPSYFKNIIQTYPDILISKDNFHYNNFIANGGLSFYYYKDRKKLDRMVLEMKIDN